MAGFLLCNSLNTQELIITGIHVYITMMLQGHIYIYARAMHVIVLCINYLTTGNFDEFDESE